jgi:hypothetical protein
MDALPISGVTEEYDAFAYIRCEEKILIPQIYDQGIAPVNAIEI